MFVNLVNNVSLLLALSICHSFIVQKYSPATIYYKVLSGILFGLVIIAGMMNPFVLTEGIIFDGRSLVASIAGLFGGPITATIVALIGCGYRWFWIGGDGALMGVSVIITSVCIGVIYHYLIKRQAIQLSYINLYILGIITHITMIMWMILLPADFAWLTIKTITVPVMVLFPIGTVLLGKLLNDQIQFRDIYQKLNESEERHRSIFENNHAVMLLLDPDTHKIIDANPAACQFYGYTRNEMHFMDLCNINTLPLNELKDEMNKARTLKKGFFVFQHRLANGEIRNVEVFSGPIKWSTKIVFLSLIFDVTEKYTAKKLLKESEKRYKSFVENSPNGIFIHSEFKIVYANQAFIRLMGGQTSNDILYRSIFDHFHKDYHEIIHQRLQIIYQNQETANPIEEIMIDLNGNELIVEISAVPIKVNEKDAAFVFVRDIREQKRSEQLLRESEERFRVALTELPFPLLIHNEHGKIIFINRAWTELSGYEYSDIPTIDDWVTNAYGTKNKGIKKTIQSLYDINQRVDEGEYIIRTKSGHNRIWNFCSAPLGRGRDGNRLVISVANDITETREQEEIFKSIVDNIPVMIGYFKVNGQYHWVNRAWENTLGVSLAEMQKSNDYYMSIFYPDENYRKEVIEFIQRADGEWGNFETTTGDYTKLQTLWSNIRLSDHSIIGIGLDITKEKNLERQLLQSQKMESVGHLAGGVAHDFNNILTAIIGYNNFAIQKINKEDAIYHDLHQVAISAERAANLTRQLLAFSRKQILKTEIVDMNKLVLDMDKMLHRLIGEDVEYITLPAERLWKVEVDPGQIEQVITNLVVNARDAMPTGGKITIETKNVIFDEEYSANHADVNPGSYVMLAVSDTGIGIPKSDLTKIFDPFFTTKEKGKGTGLGLAMVHGIIKQSGGNINLYSEVGQGTTFKLYFPKATMDTESETDKPITSKRYQGNETILIVEDDDLLRKLLIQSLENAGYNVISAAYGSEAIAVYNKYDGKIDLLVTDVIMPKMSGKELAHYLLNHHPELKVLYISGYTDNAIVHHGIIDEGVNFLQKPFSPQALLKEIRQILEG